MTRKGKRRLLWIGGILGGLALLASGTWLVLVHRCSGRILDAEAVVFAEGFEEPAGIATTSTGQILVTDAGKGEVVVLDANGSRVRTFGGDVLSYPIGIAVDPTDGSIWVSDSSDDRIHRFDAQGNHQTSFGVMGEGRGEFSGAGPLDIGPDGTVYVVDIDHGRVLAFDREGKYLFQIGEGKESGEFYYPGGLAVGNGGQVFVADTHQFHLDVFSREGRRLDSWGGPRAGLGCFDHAFGIAVDDDRDRLYVADDYVPEHFTLRKIGNRVQVFTRGGAYIGTIKPRLDGKELRHPFDVAVAADGRLFVTERGAGRVIEISVAPWNP